MRSHRIGQSATSLEDLPVGLRGVNAMKGTERVRFVASRGLLIDDVLGDLSERFSCGRPMKDLRGPCACLMIYDIAG